MIDFTFAAFDLGITTEQKQSMLEEILALPLEYWYYDTFRGCYMLPIFNGGSLTNNTSQGVLRYTEAGNLCNTIKLVLSHSVFPFMNPLGRVTILKTSKDTNLNIHLDSKEEEIGTLQHKFRLALNGKIDTLYFLDSNYNKVYVPNCYDTYILDGSHPHGLDPGPEEKITLCIGAPWNGEPTELYNQIINNSLYTMNVSRPVILPNWTDSRWK